MINLIMNIMLTLINSAITAAVVGVSLVGLGGADTNYLIGCVLAFVSGFGLRLMGDIRNKKIGWLNSFVQFVTSVCLCLAMLVFKPALASWIKLEYFIFFAALSSVWMIDMVERYFKIGLANYFQAVIKGIVNAKQIDNKEDNS